MRDRNSSRGSASTHGLPLLPGVLGVDVVIAPGGSHGLGLGTRQRDRHRFIANRDHLGFGERTLTLGFTAVSRAASTGVERTWGVGT